MLFSPPNLAPRVSDWKPKMPELQMSGDEERTSISSVDMFQIGGLTIINGGLDALATEIDPSVKAGGQLNIEQLMLANATQKMAHLSNYYATLHESEQEIIALMIRKMNHEADIATIDQEDMTKEDVKA